MSLLFYLCIAFPYLPISGFSLAMHIDYVGKTFYKIYSINIFITKLLYLFLVAGPDSYRDLPRLLALTSSGQTAVNVLLSLDETYADVVPVRLNQDSVSAFM